MRRHLFLLLFCILTALGVVWAFDKTWDDTNPTKASDADDIDVYIREDTKKAIMERFAVDHVPAFIGDTSSETVGFHKAVRLYHQSTTPETTSVGAVLWSQEDDSVSHLYFRRADGDIIRVDSANDIPADNSVTETKLVDSAVTAAKIADATITESKVEDVLRRNRLWSVRSYKQDTATDAWTQVDSMVLTNTYVACVLEITLSLPLAVTQETSSANGTYVSIAIVDDTDQDTLLWDAVYFDTTTTHSTHICMNVTKTVAAGVRTFSVWWKKEVAKDDVVTTGLNSKYLKRYRYFTIKEFRIP